MSNDEILTEFARLVQEITGINAAQVTADKSFTNDLDVDSLSMVEVATAAEDRFGIAIPDDALKNLKTVGDAVDFIAKAGVAA
jgi:acyl carrier protein